MQEDGAGEALKILRRALDADMKQLENGGEIAGPGSYLKAIRGAISEGFCPLDGSELTPGRCCLHPMHGRDGVQWTPDGLMYPLPEPMFDFRDLMRGRIDYQG